MFKHIVYHLMSTKVSLKNNITGTKGIAFTYKERLLIYVSYPYSSINKFLLNVIK